MIRDYFIKRFHVLVSHPANMAKGWRGLLEEESEHQWLAMGGFLVFILLGAILIQGTSSLPGVDYRTEGLSEVDGRVLDIAYGDSDTYTAMVLGDEGPILYHLNEKGDVNDVGAEYPDLLELSFMTQLHDGSVALSPQNNTLDIINLQEDIPQHTEINLEFQGQDFDVLDLAEQKTGDSYRWLMITDEGQSSSLRGFGPIGSSAQDLITDATLTAATVSPNIISWEMIESLGDGDWVAVGSMVNPFERKDDSPDTPQKHPVIGFISWTNGPTSPMLTFTEELDNGEIHSLIRLDNGTLLAAGTESSIHIAKDGTTTTVNVASVSAVLDDKGSVWFFGSKGSTSVIRFSEGIPETMPLAQPLPLTVEVSSISNNIVYAYGLNDAGEPVTYSIDTLASGSIESGRGFLNLMFVAISTVVMGVMFWTAFKRMQENQ